MSPWNAPLATRSTPSQRKQASRPRKRAGPPMGNYLLQRNNLKQRHQLQTRSGTTMRPRRRQHTQSKRAARQARRTRSRLHDVERATYTRSHRGATIFCSATIWSSVVSCSRKAARRCDRDAASAPRANGQRDRRRDERGPAFATPRGRR